MLRALETSNRAGTVKFVGFDAGESLIEAMREGSIHGLVAQDPFGMGYEGVKTAVAVLNGEDVIVDTAVVFRWELNEGTSRDSYVQLNNLATP